MLESSQKLAHCRSGYWCWLLTGTSVGVVAMNISMWPLHIVWTFSQHGGWALRFMFLERNRRKLYYILWPSNRSHTGLPRFKGRGNTFHLCVEVRQGSRRACREETIVLAICTKYYLPQEINPQWSTPLWPCSLQQVSSSPSLITHDQADLSFQWPSFRGEEWTVGK